MATRLKEKTTESIGAQIVAIRDKWHTKNHPFFQDFAKGKLPLRAMGLYMAQHYKFVTLALPSFGLLFYKAPDDVRRMVTENMAEEAGLAAIPRPGHKPHDHMEDIFAFCRAAGLSNAEVRATEPTPAWWGRTLHYVHTTRDEPVGVVLAMQTTQEGQQVALNIEVTLPAFAKHYGYPKGSPEIAFFEEHAEADAEHSSRQLTLCEKYLTTPELERRALKVAEEAVMLRWASISDLYRSEVLEEKGILPPGV